MPGEENVILKMVKDDRSFISLVVSGPVWLMTWYVNCFFCKCGSFLTWTTESYFFGVLGCSSYLNQAVQWSSSLKKKKKGKQTKKIPQSNKKKVLTGDFSMWLCERAQNTQRCSL